MIQEKSVENHAEGIDDGITHDSTAGEQGPENNHIQDDKQDGQNSSILAGSSAAEPDILTVGEELERLPQPKETYWMEITPEETGYYCFEARFGKEFRGDKTEFRTWMDAPSWDGLIFGGANTVCAKWSDENPNVQEVYHLYFTEDSSLQAGQKYVVSMTLEGDFDPQEIRLIKTDIPFGL